MAAAAVATLSKQATTQPQGSGSRMSGCVTDAILSEAVGQAFLILWELPTYELE